MRQVRSDAARCRAFNTRSAQPHTPKSRAACCASAIKSRPACSCCRRRRVRSRSAWRQKTSACVGSSQVKEIIKEPVVSEGDVERPSSLIVTSVITIRSVKEVSGDDFTRIQRAHLDHHVVVFRDQRITPTQQIAFSRRFGPSQIHVLHQFLLAGQPEVLVVSNVRDESGQPIGLSDGGHYWHSDLSYKERPSLGSMLHAQELPATGGDTLFANMHAAWEALPSALQQSVSGLRAQRTPT